MESSSGMDAAKENTTKDMTEEQKIRAEEQEALDKKFSIPTKVLFNSCSELNQIHQ